MNLAEELTKEDIELLREKNYKIEGKEYTKEELIKMKSDIEDDIMICSTKNNDIYKMSNKFENVLEVLDRAIKSWTM